MGACERGALRVGVVFRKLEIEWLNRSRNSNESIAIPLVFLIFDIVDWALRVQSKYLASVTSIYLWHISQAFKYSHSLIATQTPILRLSLTTAKVICNRCPAPSPAQRVAVTQDLQPQIQSKSYHYQQMPPPTTSRSALRWSDPDQGRSICRCTALARRWSIAVCACAHACEFMHACMPVPQCIRVQMSWSMGLSNTWQHRYPAGCHARALYLVCHDGNATQKICLFLIDSSLILLTDWGRQELETE